MVEVVSVAPVWGSMTELGGLDGVASWTRAWGGVGAVGDGGALMRKLVACYGEPQRKYHTLQHLAECLAMFESALGLAPHAAEVEVAIWFHDAIYDVRGSDNEARSAAWAKTELVAAGVSSEVSERVAALVLATRHDALPVTLDAQVLVDVDLAILGAPADRFAEYERQVREEYSFVPGFLFRRKRRAILRSFLARPYIYSTEYFRSRLEQAARANLQYVTR